MYYNHRLKSAIILGLFLFIIIMLPSVIWKSYNFDASYIDSLLRPLPGIYPGVASFEDVLRTYRDSHILFPLSLLIPGSVGGVTTIIGAGIFVLLFFNYKDSIMSAFIFALSIMVFLLAAYLGPPTSRSYLEPFFWIMIALSIQKPPLLRVNGQYEKWLKIPIFLQISMVFFIFVYSLVMFGSGVVSASNRKSVMINHADGYKVMDWVDSILPKEAVLLSMHRSKGLSPRKTVSLDWSVYIDYSNQNNSSNYYIDLIKTRKVTHILMYDMRGGNSGFYNVFSGCIGKVIGEVSINTATRKPFNKGLPYNMYAAELDLLGSDCNL
jgi:hypothetical protein